MKIAVLMILLGAGMTVGMVWGAAEFVSQLPHTRTFTDINEVRLYGQSCHAAGRTYRVETIWPESGPRVPEAFVVTCRVKR